MEEIRTSDEEWGEKLAASYKHRRDVRLIDDAKLGVDPAEQSLGAMLATGAARGALGPDRVVAALIAVGLSAVGAVIVAAAFRDPEPTSKLMLIVAAGAVMILCGGVSAIVRRQSNVDHGGL
jgi:hypothetical protein